MNYSKKYLNSMGYVGEEDICREDSIIDAICNILYVGGEMTTQEIFKGLVKEGVTWKGKKPITSLILTGVLHRETTRKVTQKFKRSIIKVGRGRWKIIYKGKFSNL